MCGGIKQINGVIVAGILAYVQLIALKTNMSENELRQCPPPKAYVRNVTRIAGYGVWSVPISKKIDYFVLSQQQVYSENRTYIYRISTSTYACRLRRCGDSFFPFTLNVL